jgi:hypothetical protein
MLIEPVVDSHLLGKSESDFLKFLLGDGGWFQAVEFNVHACEEEGLFKLDELEDFLAEQHFVKDALADWFHLEVIASALLVVLGSAGDCYKSELANEGIVAQVVFDEVRGDFHQVGCAPGPGDVLVFGLT